jgi:hypothetical protein
MVAIARPCDAHRAKDALEQPAKRGGRLSRAHGQGVCSNGSSTHSGAEGRRSPCVGRYEHGPSGQSQSSAGWTRRRFGQRCCPFRPLRCACTCWRHLGSLQRPGHWRRFRRYPITAGVPGLHRDTATTRQQLAFLAWRESSKAQAPINEPQVVHRRRAPGRLVAPTARAPEHRRRGSARSNPWSHRVAVDHPALPSECGHWL